jgi:trehalose/maltose hydrolase-like predicted phosphorylase
VKAGRPTGTQPVQGGTAKPGGAKYPWESSVTGRETVPGPSKFEDHITGSVAWGLTQLEWLGILPAVRVAPVRAAAATFYMARSVPGPNGREIQGTMSPDEHHTGDNDLYTNLLAQWLTGESFKLPKDGTSFLTYDGDRLAGYKQAAAVLAVYPLQHPAAEKQAAAMLKRFAPKVTKNGPAMTDSVHAVIAARSGDAETAYGYWQDAWRPFTGHALGLFSEKRTSDRTVFMTGAGGGLQAVLYGFAGMRIDPPKSAVPRSGFQVKLKSGATMSVRPQLPKTWLSMNIRNATVDGVRRRITITPNLISVRPELP